MTGDFIPAQFTGNPRLWPAVLITWRMNQTHMCKLRMKDVQHQMQLQSPPPRMKHRGVVMLDAV